MTKSDEIETGENVKELKGMGGWLLFFVIVAFCSMILNLVTALQGGESSFGGSIMVSNPIQAFLLALLFLATAVVLLTVRNASAVLLAQFTLGFYLVSNILVALFGLKAPAGYSIINREGTIIEFIIKAIVINLIWQTYFIRSKRVRATYPALAGKSIASVFDRSLYGINYYVGIGFFIAMTLSEILFMVYYPLINNQSIHLSLSTIVSLLIPIYILESVLFVLLLHFVRNEWLLATLMGMGALALSTIWKIVLGGGIWEDIARSGISSTDLGTDAKKPNPHRFFFQISSSGFRNSILAFVKHHSGKYRNRPMDPE